MKIIRLPDTILAFLLDIDGTLYSMRHYVNYQTDALIRQFAEYKGLEVKEAARLVEKTRQEASQLNGANTSLANIMAILGVDMTTSVQWRKILFKPENYLKPDPALRLALLKLMEPNLNDSGSLFACGVACGKEWSADKKTAAKVKLAAVTNNPHSVAEAGLKALGVLDLFDSVIGLDDTMKSKPDLQPFILAAKLLGIGPEYCVSVGDRYDIDLAPALKLGMGAILVNGAEDIYTLPGKLGRNISNAVS